MKGTDIKKIAFAIFAEKGYDATTMNDIARAAGIQKASLYFHFESKASLFLGILDDEAKEYQNFVLGFLASARNKDAENALKDFYENTVAYFSRREKLLYWKRVKLMRLARTDAELEAPINQMLDEMDGLIRLYLEGALLKRFDRFVVDYIIVYFNLFILGFLDAMLLEDTIANEASFYWGIFWNGVKYTEETLTQK